MTRVLVRLPDWMVVSGDIAEPVAGVVQRLGLVVFSNEFGARRDEAEALLELRRENLGTAPLYRITATVLGAVDVDVGPGAEHDAGCELHVSVLGHRMLIRLRGRANTWAVGDRISIDGNLSVLATYEYEAFDLPDVRSDWIVLSVEEGGYDDHVVEVESA